MFSSVLRFTILALVSVSPLLAIDGVAAFEGNRCGTIAPAGQEMVRIEHNMRTYATSNPRNNTRAEVTLNVYFHVVAESNERAGGMLPDTMLQKQIDVLNADYAGSGLSFRLATVDRTVNSEWYRKVYHGTAEESAMTKALRKGSADAVNIYTVGFTEQPPKTDPLLGYATFPWDYQSKPSVDGIFLRGETLPSGTAAPYDLGKTATHEIGHWMGLYHTFQGDCNSPGDYVDDTPYEAGPATGCPSGRDSCPAPGLDPIHNYMDYSDDACLTEFTPGQSMRLRQALNQFRGVSL